MSELTYELTLAHLKAQLQQLNEGTLPEYTKGLQRLKVSYLERKNLSKVSYDLDAAMVKHDYINEKRSIRRELKEQKDFLRNQLIGALEDKRRMVETERNNMKLTKKNIRFKLINNRKLRRRPNEANHGGNGDGNQQEEVIGKSREANTGEQQGITATLNYLLQDQEINEDLKIILENTAFPIIRKFISRCAKISRPNSNSGVKVSKIKLKYVSDMNICQIKTKYAK